MEYLTTATGRKISCDYFNPNQPVPQVDIQISGLSVAEAAAVFSNKEETKQLWYGNQYLAHYTQLVAIIPDSGSIRVVLRKE
ncbi:MAG: hypothetical protein MSS60_03490 [Clostridiales bacterium]|nr:hypothetical protein [Clostridiales bacterium]